MTSFADIVIRVKAGLEQFSSDMQNVQRQLDKAGKKLNSVGKKLAVGLTVPIIALGVESVKAFDMQEKALAQVESALVSTGNTANKTFQELQGNASDLQNNTLFGDEEILQSVTAQLLTFTNIANEQFDRTQQAALDLATRLDGDLKGASIQLGKALNDPVKGLSSLGKSGIQFSEDQKKVINALAESGRLAEAQTIILNELETQYGGAAAAAAKAGTGPLKQLSNILGDITEDFGKIILEALAPFIEKVKQMALAFQNFSPQAKKMVVVVGGIAAALGPAALALGSLIPMLPVIASGLAAMISPIGILVTAFAAATAAFVVFNEDLHTSVNELNDFTGSLLTNAVSIDKNLDKVEALVTEYDELKNKSDLNKKEQKRLKEVIEQLSKEMPSAIEAFDSYGNALDVNSGKVRKFLTDQTELNKAQAKVNLNNLETALVSLQEEQKKLNALNEEGNSAYIKGIGNVKRLNGVLGQGRGLRFKPLDDEAILLFQQRKAANAEDLEITKQNIQKNKELLGVLDGIKKLEETSLDNNASKKSKVSVEVDVNDLSNQINEGISKLKPIVVKPALKVESNNLSSESFGASNVIKPQIDTSSMSAAESELSGFQQRLQGFQEVSGQVLSNAAQNFASGFGQILGQIAAGNAGFGSIAGLLLQTIADVAKQLGEAAIAIGFAMEGIKAAFSNPATAIAAGVALVAIGSFIEASIPNIVSGKGGGETPFANGGLVFGPTRALVGEYQGARNNPEVIAPLNKLRDYIKPQQMTQQVFIPEMRISGADMKVVFNRQNKRDNRRS